LLLEFLNAKTNPEPIKGKSNSASNICYCNKKLTIKIKPIAKDIMRT
jgi:hypothetical protein